VPCYQVHKDTQCGKEAAAGDTAPPATAASDSAGPPPAEAASAAPAPAASAAPAPAPWATVPGPLTVDELHRLGIPCASAAGVSLRRPSNPCAYAALVVPARPAASEDARVALADPVLRSRLAEIDSAPDPAAALDAALAVDTALAATLGRLLAAARAARDE